MKVKQSPSYPFLTKKAASIIEKSISNMIEKLSKLEHVEFLEGVGHNGEDSTLPLNSDTESQLIDAVDEEIRLNLRRYCD